MNFFPKRAALMLVLLVLAGCSHPPSPPAPKISEGVTANSGGDTRGTILYQPAPPPETPPNPYTLVSDKFVIGQRRQMAWTLAEVDSHAHLQALHAYPVPNPSWKGYTKQKASVQAQRQARFNAYLLDIPWNKIQARNSTRCCANAIQAGTTFMGAKLFHGISIGKISRPFL